MNTFPSFSKWPVTLGAALVVIAAVVLTRPTRAQGSETPPGEGLARAIVVDRQDPEAAGRIKVRFPWLPSESPLWAQVALPIGARPGRFDLPETGDEVIVGFEHGDLRQPIVIGFLWNGDHPPTSR